MIYSRVDSCQTLFSISWRSGHARLVQIRHNLSDQGSTLITSTPCF